MFMGRKKREIEMIRAAFGLFMCLAWRCAARTGFIWRGKDLYLQIPASGPITIAPVSRGTPIAQDGASRIALLPEGQPAFLKSKNVLFINELRFRLLLNDVYESPGCHLVRAYVDSTGAIEPSALLCRVTECKRLSSGQAMYIITGEERVEIQDVCLDSNKQYLMAEVTPLPDKLDENGRGSWVLAREVFVKLKYYLRLARRVPSIDSSEDPESMRYFCLSPAILEAFKEQNAAAFSHAVSNLINTTPAVMQQLFAGSVNERLSGLGRILNIALDNLTMDLKENGVLDQLAIDDLKDASARDDDPTDDLLPPIDFEEVTLEGIEAEFDQGMLADIAEGSEDDSGDPATKDTEDDSWGAGAFQ